MNKGYLITITIDLLLIFDFNKYMYINVKF